MEELSNDAWLAKWPTVALQAKKLEAALRRGDISGSYACALQTVALLRNVVGTCKWQTAGELLTRVKWIGERLVGATDEVTVGNAVRRVLAMIRDDYGALQKVSSGPGGLQDVFSRESTFLDDPDLKQVLPELKPSLMEQILETYDDIENGVEAIAAQIQLQSQDVILMVYDSRDSDGVDAILTATSGVKDLLVVTNDKQLPKTTRNVTYLPETAIVAVMPRVQSVLLAARAVAADGSFVAAPGAFLAALAAHNFAKPVLAVAALYKLSPDHVLTPTGHQPMLRYADLPSSPDREPDFFSGNLGQDVLASPLDVVNPDFDHVPAHLVDLFITNTGAHQPSYVGRLLSELYSPHDALLFHNPDIIPSSDDDLVNGDP